MEAVFQKITDAIEQDIGMWVVVAFTCAVLVWAAALIDLWTGIEAARANREPISSHSLRRTVGKVVDYLRVMRFCALIDTLGLFFSWYVLPYFVIVCTLGVLLIEMRSVIENSRKKKSHAADILDAVEDIIQAATQQDAERIIDRLRDDSKELKNPKTNELKN